MIQLGGKEAPGVYVMPFNITLSKGGCLEIRHSEDGGHVILWNGCSLLDRIEDMKLREY